MSLLSNPEKPLKESPKPINNTLFLNLAVSAAKPRHRRHDLVDIRSRSLDLAVSERIVNKLACFGILEVFRLNKLRNSFFALLCDKVVPFRHNIVNIVDTLDKSFNKMLFAAQLGASVHCLADSDKHFLILAVSIMILLNQHKNLVDIYLDLLYQFDLENNIVNNILAFAFCDTFFPFVMQVLISSEIVLPIAFRENFLSLEFVK